MRPGGGAHHGLSPNGTHCGTPHPTFAVLGHLTVTRVARGTVDLSGKRPDRLRREDPKPRMMVMSTRSSVRTRTALRTADASSRRRQAPSARPSDRAFYDGTMQPGEVVEFDPRVTHLFGPAGARPGEILSILGREDDRIHVRVTPRRKSATG